MKKSAILFLVLLVLGGALFALVRGTAGRGGKAGAGRAAGGGAGFSPAALLGGSARERAQGKFEDGKALEDLDRLDEAERAFQDAAAADSTFAPPVAHLGALRVVRGDRVAARPLLEKALALDPRNADAHFHLAFVLEEDRELERAEAEYRAVIETDSAYAEAYNNLGHLLIRLGRADEAVVVLEEGKRRDPESPFVAKNLGRAYARARRWSEARPLLEHALPLAGHDPEVLLDLACVRRAAGNEPEALKLFRQYEGIQRDPALRAAGGQIFAATKKS